MKKLILGAFALALFASCQTEPTDVVVNEETANLQLMVPSASLDNSRDGMYAGVIVADNNNFHGKLWINLKNNTKYSAMIETIQKEVHYFRLSKNTNGIFTFNGAIGSFDFDPSNTKNTEISNVVINNTNGVARVLKETSQARMMAMLGTYDNQFGGDETGTWNFLAPDQEGSAFNLVAEVMITTSTNHMILEDSTTFEAGEFGCYNFGGPIAPVYANYPNEDDIPDDPFTPDVDESATRDFMLYAVNQTLPIPNVDNKTVLYDLGFSQDVNDSNSLTGYARMLAFPEATRGPIFGAPDLASGCYNIDGDACNGYYAVVDDAGVLTEGGRIFIDTSSLIQPPPPPPTSTSTFTSSIQTLERR